MQLLEYGWALLMGYVAIGMMFAVPFVVRGISRVDPQGASATWGFRLLLIPGCTLLWPLLWVRWSQGRSHPPEESIAHRKASRLV